jgi:hypothetical protein
MKEIKIFMEDVEYEAITQLSEGMGISPDEYTLRAFKQGISINVRGYDTAARSMNHKELILKIRAIQEVLKDWLIEPGQMI